MKGFFTKLPTNIIHVFSPRNLGWHLLAIVLTFIIVSTGFDWLYYINVITDISHQFQFGFWEHGIFWGWPSSHTTVAFAMAVSLMYLYPKNKLIRYLAPLYALYIGLGISIGIHWFSEFIAGIIFGSLIGVVVGRFFKGRS
jgi:membrane-associated phospholipid phosphatase